MKLLGAELANFACFDRQYVPLRDGISVLAGKNNAGKTAILRGLSALHSLPLGPALKGLPISLAGYLRNDGSGFELDLLCQLDKADRKVFFCSDAPIDWVDSLIDKGLARWRFWVAANGPVIFRGCSFQSGNNRFEPILVQQDGYVLVNKLQFPRLKADAPHSIANRTSGPGQPILDIGIPETAILETIGTVKLVSPHRVVLDGMNLQTELDLPSDARNLAQFLQTLQGRDREIFHAIESFVTEVFPEFRYVNAVSGLNNQVSIQLTESNTSKKIPLSNCGTGVEQILTLAAFVLATPAPGLLLLDEPHSYLHPVAEKALVQFLHTHSGHKYLISTHSAILINSIEPDRVIYVSPPGKQYNPAPVVEDVSKMLFDLGYRNSDLLFYDRLIVVEGLSDQEILPILLLADGEFPQSELNRTGFPVLDGVGKGSTSIQTSIFRYEKLLSAVGRVNQPRIYLLDGDRRDDEKGVLKGTRSPITGDGVEVEFLPRLELENYLLVPEAISEAVREELALAGTPRDVELKQVQTALDLLLQSEDEKLFPQGKIISLEPQQQAKGSLVLERLYEGFGLQYNKRRSGTLIAKHVTAQNQRALSELTNAVKRIFQKAKRGA
jgi:hypothetical protein